QLPRARAVEEGGIDAAYALVERRMRGHERREVSPDGLTEAEVPEVLRVAGVEYRSLLVLQDLPQRPGNAVGIARELHAGRIGEELALARDRRLDERAEEDPDVADDEEREAHEGDLVAVLVAPPP